MSLLRPIKSTGHGLQGVVSQTFDGQFAWEPPGYLHAGNPAKYGRRTALVGATRYAHLHLAIDYIAITGSQLFACHSGRVVAQFTDLDGAVILYLRVRRTPTYDVYAAYWHLQRNSFQQPIGTLVKRGAFIARSGATGQVTGPHLHFELWRAPRGTAISKLWSTATRYDPQPFIDGMNLTRIAP